MNKRIAAKDDWKLKPLPKARALIDYHPVFSKEQFERIRRGNIPESMDDHWFIYYAEPWLFWHRSWTGYGIYGMRLESLPDGYRVAETWASRNAKQYMENPQPAEEIILFNELFGIYFPPPKALQPKIRIANLDQDVLDKIKGMEEELGCPILALEPYFSPAQLNDQQVQKLKSLEAELGVVLLAYEK